MRLYKYTAWKPFGEEYHDNYYVKENLVKHQFYYNLSDYFNDPFELKPYLEFSPTYEELVECIMTKIRRYNRQLARIAVKEKAEKTINQLELNTEKGQQIAKRKLNLLIGKVRICCFTKNGPDTILM